MVLLGLGMDNATTLERVQSGYRMPRPTALQGGTDCPLKMYEMMEKCWDKRPEQRPTFAYLREFFDDYATETEGQYQQQDWNAMRRFSCHRSTPSWFYSLTPAFASSEIDPVARVIQTS